MRTADFAEVRLRRFRHDSTSAASDSLMVGRIALIGRGLLHGPDVCRPGCLPWRRRTSRPIPEKAAKTGWGHSLRTGPIRCWRLPSPCGRLAPRVTLGSLQDGTRRWWARGLPHRPAVARRGSWVIAAASRTATLSRNDGRFPARRRRLRSAPRVKAFPSGPRTTGCSTAATWIGSTW